MALAIKTLIKLLTDELKQAMSATVDVDAEAEAMKAKFAAMEDAPAAPPVEEPVDPPVKKKRGRSAKTKGTPPAKRPRGRPRKPAPEVTQEIAA